MCRLGTGEDMISDGVGALAASVSGGRSKPRRWRTFTPSVSACAFPLTMGVVEAHCHELENEADRLLRLEGESLQP